jgi:hypothetical protein
MAETTDWTEWHSAYDDPGSSLSQRLVAVREQLRRVLVARGGRPTHVVSICAGDGRDALPVIATADAPVEAVLVELDEHLGAAARQEADRLGLARVVIRREDAGSLDSFAGVPPADVLMACGVFGNVTDDDLETTIRTLPQLLAADAAVIWTRGRPRTDPTRHDGDPADLVRAVFARHNFAEEAFIRPDDADYRVGVHRFAGEPQQRTPGTTMFRFVR